jgi:hypothetical protein
MGYDRIGVDDRVTMCRRGNALEDAELVRELLLNR